LEVSDEMQEVHVLYNDATALQWHLRAAAPFRNKSRFDVIRTVGLRLTSCL